MQYVRKGTLQARPLVRFLLLMYNKKNNDIFIKI